jgi:hypothetical protein
LVREGVSVAAVARATEVAFEVKVTWRVSAVIERETRIHVRRLLPPFVETLLLSHAPSNDNNQRLYVFGTEVTDVDYY